MPDQGQRPAAVFFDLDGTLIDTAPDFIRAINRLRQSEGQSSLPAETLREVISDGSKAMIERAFGLSPEKADFERLRQQLLTFYLSEIAVESALFPGMDTLLVSLETQQIPWGIVTNKPRLYSEALLREMALMPRLAALVCADDLPRAKPHPDPLLRAAELTRVQPENCVYVGDHIRDIQAGKAAGMQTIACCYGYISESESPADWQADLLVSHASEIATLIGLEKDPRD